jgi:hypothetical protein
VVSITDEAVGDPSGNPCERLRRSVGKYQKVLVHTTNPDHLVPSTPSLTDIPPLQVVRRYRREDGSVMNRSPR